MRIQKTNPKAYLNYLHAQYEAMTGAVLVQSYPYILNIDPVSVCQLRCPGCPTGIENESRRIRNPVAVRERVKMSTGFFEALLDEIGDYLFVIMLYNWGEPLLHRELPAFIRKAKEYQIGIDFHTNLSLRMDDARLESILSAGVDVIGVSLDGFSQETYQTYRRGGNFELAKTNITRLAAARKRLSLKTEIVWNFLVFSFNEHEIDAARRYCDQIGITFNRRDAFIQNPDWLPSYRQNEAEQLRNPTPPQPAPADSMANRPPRPCAWHYSYSAINANGSVSACCTTYDERQDFGKLQLGTVSFRDVWNNNMYRKARSVFAHKPVSGLEQVDNLCLHCPYDVGVQNLYAYLDRDVRAQFRRVIGDKDPLLDEGIYRLSSPASFLEFFTHNMGEILGREHDPAVVQPASSPVTKYAPGFTWISLRWYRNLKEKLKPYTARLFKRYPSLYFRGKALEKRFTRR